jgi:hypothetical protein
LTSLLKSVMTSKMGNFPHWTLEVKMVECLEKLSQKMANSDHRTVYIRKVLITGIEKYDAKLKKSLLPAGDPAYQPLHLGTHYKSKGRWRKKVMVKEDCYRNSTGEKQGLGGSQMSGKRKKYPKRMERSKPLQ